MRFNAISHRLGVGLLATLVAMAVLAGGARAQSARTQSVPKDFWGAPRPDASRGDDYSVETEQTYLLWVGFYYGRSDGKRGPETVEAIERFQRSLGESATGRLSARQRRVLQERAKRAEVKAGFKRVDDEWTGISVPLPLGYLSDPEITPDPKRNAHVTYRARGSANLTVELVRFEGLSASPKQVFQIFLTQLEKQEGARVVASAIVGDVFRIATVEGKENDPKIYFNRIFQVRNREARGVVIRHPVGRLNIFAPVQSLILSELEPFAGRGLSKAERARRTASKEFPGFRERPSWYRTLYATGSGSIVSYKGHILTNFHVVDGCHSLTVNGNPALLLGVDIVNDLALVSSKKYADRDPVRFRAPDARLGEAVMVMGYPLFNVSQSLNLTTGVVSARAGLFGDRRNIQITAPVQPGNSGGPVLDRDGNQIAVVVTKASASFQINSNAENMAWVIRGNIARDFLLDHGVAPFVSESVARGDTPLVQVVERAQRYTVRVECHKE